MSLLAKRRRRAEINIVPLIDVLTMLIFFFLVTMQFREVVTLNLTLPRIETAGRTEFQGPIIIGIDRDERISINGQEATDLELEAAVRAIRSADRDATILIKADEETPLKRVTFVMDTCRRYGLNKIRLQGR